MPLLRWIFKTLILAMAAKFLKWVIRRIGRILS